MLHSNSNTHANQDPTKDSDRQGNNTFSAQGATYNPAGGNTTNTNSTYNTTNNPGTGYDNLIDKTANLNLNNTSSNATNPNTKSNVDTIGGGLLGSNTYNNSTNTNSNSYKVSPGVTQPPLTSEYPGVLPNRSSNIPLETASGQTGHGSSLHNQSLGSNQEQNKSQTHTHSGQYGHSNIHDQKPHNNIHGHTSSTIPTGHNNSSVTDEIYGAEFGKVPVHEQTITGDHMQKNTHKANHPERIGGNRRDEKEVATGLVSEKLHSHLDHTHGNVRENHKLDLGSSLDDKHVYADPNSTSLYNEYTPAVPGEGVKPSNLPTSTLGLGTHNKHTGETHFGASGNSHHSNSSHKAGSNIDLGVVGATGAALGATAFANIHDSQHRSSEHKLGSNNNTSGAALGDVGSANIYESKNAPTPHNSSSNATSGANLGAAGLANVYEDKHQGSIPNNSNTQQPSLTGSALNNSNVPGTAYTPADGVRNNNEYTGSTTGHHTSSNLTHGNSKIVGATAVGAGATGTASALNSHNNKPPHDTSLGTNNKGISGTPAGIHSSVKPAHGSTLDNQHHKPTNTTFSGAGAHGNAPHGATIDHHSSHKPAHGNNKIGTVSHPALDPSHDLDAFDTKPSKMGGYMDKMKGTIHEGLGKALNNEEMIEKGTLEKAKGEQKILLSQAENQSNKKPPVPI